MTGDTTSSRTVESVLRDLHLDDFVQVFQDNWYLTRASSRATLRVVRANFLDAFDI